MAANQDPTKRYPFLHDHVAREPYIYDVLDEIVRLQDQFRKTLTGELASLEGFKNSRTLKIPLTPTRNRNILYLLELLAKTYPEEIKIILSMDFIADPITKKLSINEKKEYTLKLNSEDLSRIQADRDKKTLESLVRLLSMFRLFNLTKLLKRAQNRAYLTKLIKMELGKSIFTFKHYDEKNADPESAEDYCFHISNYEQVMQSFKIDTIQKILTQYSVQVIRYLKKYGILTADITDYRENKVDYILNILLNDMPVDLSERDNIEVRNFQSLRSCLMKVDRLIDPMIAQSKDILNYIRENRICRRSDILALFERITAESLTAWAAENGVKNKILSGINESGEDVYVDGNSYLPEFAKLQQAVIINPGSMSSLGHFEKQKKSSDLDLLCSLGKYLLYDGNRARAILESDENIARLGQLIQEYENFKKSQRDEKDETRESDSGTGGKSFFRMIIDFFKSLFGRKKNGKDRGAKEKAAMKPAFIHYSRETKNLQELIKERKSNLIPLSDFIELNDENKLKIDRLIDEIRAENKKIVIPIFNAQRHLYPVRSQKYLISDTEYLLVNADIASSPESIRGFSGSLSREKLKDEIIPQQGILAIEKYLLTLYRQKKAQFQMQKMNKPK